MKNNSQKQFKIGELVRKTKHSDCNIIYKITGIIQTAKCDAAYEMIPVFSLFEKNNLISKIKVSYQTSLTKVDLVEIGRAYSSFVDFINENYVTQFECQDHDQKQRDPD